MFTVRKIKSTAAKHNKKQYEEYLDGSEPTSLEDIKEQETVILQKSIEDSMTLDASLGNKVEFGTMTTPQHLYQQTNYNNSYNHKRVHDRNCKNKTMINFPTISKKLLSSLGKQNSLSDNHSNINIKKSRIQFYKNVQIKKIEEYQYKKKTPLLGIYAEQHNIKLQKISIEKLLHSFCVSSVSPKPVNLQSSYPQIKLYQLNSINSSKYLSIMDLFALYIKHKSEQLDRARLCGNLNNKIIKPFLLLYKSLLNKSPIQLPSTHNQQQQLLKLFNQNQPGHLRNTTLITINNQYKSSFTFYDSLHKLYQSHPFSPYNSNNNDKKTQQNQDIIRQSEDTQLTSAMGASQLKLDIYDDKDNVKKVSIMCDAILSPDQEMETKHRIGERLASCYSYKNLHHHESVDSNRKSTEGEQQLKNIKKINFKVIKVQKKPEKFIDKIKQELQQLSANATNILRNTQQQKIV